MSERTIENPAEADWQRHLVKLAVGVVGIVILMVFYLQAQRDPTLDAVKAHPMANPSFSVGQISSQSAVTNRTATVEIFGRGRKYTEAQTRISVSEDQVPALHEEIRLQAEALGYEFQEGSWSFELFAPEIAAYPGTSLVIGQHRDFVKVVVRGNRDHFE